MHSVDRQPSSGRERGKANKIIGTAAAAAVAAACKSKNANARFNGAEADSRQSPEGRRGRGRRQTGTADGREGERAVEFFPASANGAKNIIKATAECHSDDWPNCPPRLPGFRDLLYVQFTVLKRENPVYKMGKYYDFILSTQTACAVCFPAN